MCDHNHRLRQLESNIPLKTFSIFFYVYGIQISDWDSRVQRTITSLPDLFVVRFVYFMSVFRLLTVFSRTPRT